MKIKKTSLIGLVGATILATGISSCFIQCNDKTANIQERAPIVLELNKNDKKQRNKETIYRESKSYLEEFISDYVNDFAPFSDEMRNNIKAFGGGEIGKNKVIDGYVNLYTICLDTALNNIKDGLDSKEVDELSDRLVTHHKGMIKITDISLKHPAVKEGYETWGKSKVDYFRQIINSNLNNPGQNFREMVRNAYPTKELLFKELKIQNKAEKTLFEGFRKSLENRNLLIKLIGPLIIKTSQKKSWELNKRELYRFYDKDE